jgi:hypothetical protein
LDEVVEVKKGRHKLTVNKRYDLIESLILYGNKVKPKHGLALVGFYDALAIWINRENDIKSRKIDKVNEKFLIRSMGISKDYFTSLKIELFECGLLDIEKGRCNKNVFILHEWPEYYTNINKPMKLHKYRDWNTYQNELTAMQTTENELTVTQSTATQTTATQTTVINNTNIINKDNIISDLMEFDSIKDLQDYYVKKYNLPWERVLIVYDRVKDQYKAGNIKISFTAYLEAALEKEKKDYERNKFID